MTFSSRRWKYASCPAVRRLESIKRHARCEAPLFRYRHGGEGAGYGYVHIPPNYHYLLIAKAMLVGWDVNVPSVVSCRVKHVLRTHNTRLRWWVRSRKRRGTTRDGAQTGKERTRTTFPPFLFFCFRSFFQKIRKTKKKHMNSLLSFESKHIHTFFPIHDKTCLNCSTNQKHDDLLEVFGAVRDLRGEKGSNSFFSLITIVSPSCLTLLLQCHLSCCVYC